MRISLCCFSLMMCFSDVVLAQYVFVKGDHTLQLSGQLSVYYNHRILKDGEEDKKNNRFRLRDMQVGFNGRKGNVWEYKLRADLADLAANAGGGAALDPENPGLMSAYVVYKALPVHIQLGYDKLPYSLSSMQTFEGSVFWQRGQLLRGDFFSRRDAGLTLSTSLWQQRINIYGGVYTGLGENIIVNNDNDPSGRPEFVGRVDVAYPSRYRYRELDLVSVRIPMVRLGANVRHTDKTQPPGEVLPEGVAGEYGLRIIDGKRTVYGVDAAFQFRGFSAQFEAHTLNLKPAQPNDPLYSNTSDAVNKGVVKAGGIQGQVNYCYLPARSVLSVRYENYNLNDLITGHTERLGVGYAYMFHGMDIAFKIHYYKILNEDQKSESLKWTDQVRVGFQYEF